MRTRASAASAAACLALAVALIGSMAPATAAPGLPAPVASVVKRSATESFRTFSGSGERLADTQWRVVEPTGNCCENYLAASASGRLLDFGGSRLHFSDDRGLTWKVVLAGSLILSAEGAVVAAPGGDVVGMTWDPYSGDRIVSVKFDAATQSWQYSYVLLHTPFFDRPWIAVVPGPWTFGTETVPYITVLMSNFTPDLLYYSLDGLNYTYAGSKLVSAMIGGDTRPFAVAAGAGVDELQPHSESQIAPLPGRGAIATDVCGTLGVMRDAEIRWSCARRAPAVAGHRVLVDARGFLHRLRLNGTTLTYEVSTDSGLTWDLYVSALADGGIVEDWDVKTHGDRTALVVHARMPSGNDQDLLYTFTTVSGSIALERLVLLGRGDMSFDSGITGARRFDFTNVVFLPDGKLAASFVDSVHRISSIAVEL